MRTKLKSMNGKTITVTGCFNRYGVKDGDGARWNTAVLTNIEYNGEIITSHLWFTLRKEWLRTELVGGTKLRVTGRIEKYKRSNGSVDYGLVDTKDLNILEQGAGGIKPAKKWFSKSYSYFKFLTELGPKWFRLKDNVVERVVFIYNGKGFDEKVIPTDKDDVTYMNIILS